MTAVTDRTRRRKPPKPPGKDPATQYALDVCAGRIVAGRAVRQACQRHLTDLTRQRTTAFPYYFDPKAAQHLIDFFPTFLTLENGEPFVLPPWLRFCYGCLFGWKRVNDDERKFQYAYFETSKGSGKSPGSGGLGLYGLTFDDEPFAEIYSAAFDKGQASIILNDAIRMANGADELREDEALEVGKYNIANKKNGSFFRAVSAEHRGKSGPRPHMVLADEPHEWRDGSVVNKLVAGFKFRTQPLVVFTTNSGSDKTSVCWEYHQKSLAVLDGTQVDEQWFAYVCHLDPCETCYTDGYRQPRDGCETCDNWMDPAVWPKVAPALGIVIQPKYLQDAIERAITIPSEYSLIRRLNFCIWTETHQVWIPPDKWHACEVPTVHEANTEMWPCAIGLDPASTLDLASAVVALRIDDPPDVAQDAEQVEIEGMDEFGERIRFAYLMNFSIELIPFFWIPKDTLLERVRTERIPYDIWARDRKLVPTPGASIDHHAIYDFVLKDLWKRFKAQKLAMDQNGGRYLYMKFQNEGRLREGDQLVSVGQAKKLSEAFKFMEILIAKRRLRHDGHPVLAWNMANAEPQRDRIGALWIEKPSESKRIDGVVAAAMAIKELMALPVRKKKSAGVFFV